MRKITELLVLLCLLMGVVTINSCKKEDALPTLTTNNATNVTISSVTSGGKITNTGGADVTARGVCWSTSRNPVISGSHTTDGKGSGSLPVQLPDLQPIPYIT
ncbi:MAG: hypothetical protein IPJ37_20170 [Bacteroidales bacterium]|nr:hypothetical protein [Bacteroidales bacterium]